MRLHDVNTDVVRSPGTPPDRLPDGEPPDVAELFRQHHLELVRLALLVVGDRATAEDVDRTMTRPRASSASPMTT